MRPVFVVCLVVVGALMACGAGEKAPAEVSGAIPAAPEPEPSQPPDEAVTDDNEPTPPSPNHELGLFHKAEDPCAANAKPGLYHLETEFNGKTVKSFLYVPAAAGPHDLVVLLHAGSATPQKILAQTRFAEQAEKDGFVVLAPMAGEVADRGAHWNSGKFSTVVDEDQQRDDVAFLDTLTKKVKTEICAKRVLTAGFSSGGQMAHRWGCEGKEVDAVLTAAGELLVDPESCSPRAVRGYVGTEDKVFRGPPLEGSDQPSAVQTIELWAKINRCNDEPPTETKDAEVTCKEWHGCKESTELCVVDGFPHGWPSPWHRKRPIHGNATADGIAWFRSAHH